jgi:hypothetical protein
MNGGINKKEYENQWCYFPMLASVTERDGKYRTTSEEDDAIWEKYDSLPPEIQDIITAREIPEAIYNYGQKWGLPDGETAYISVAVRKFYFHEWSLQECGNNIYSHFSANKSDQQNVQGMIESFQKEILAVRPADKNEKPNIIDSLMERLALLSAIGKYPRLGEQQITKERIKLRNQSEPARPSLANWIRVYRDELGVGHHDPMIRGKFLFDSENGKRLSSEERERINIILRSIEENAPLDIDTEKTEIVFPGFASVPVAPKAPAQVAVPREIPVVTPIPVPRPVPTSVPMTASQSDFVPVRPVVPVRRPPSQIRPMTSPFHDTPVFAAPPIPTVATYLPNTAPSREATFSAPAPSQNVTPPTPSAPIAGLPTPPQAPVRRPVSFAPEPPPDLPVGGTFSFSSSHALPIESEEGKFSIHDSETDEADDSLSHSPTLPSAIPIFGNANLIPLASSDRNPFHIHPVGIREEKKKPDDDTGRTVDLRG